MVNSVMGRLSSVGVSLWQAVLFASLCGILATAGCGSSGPALQPVSGTVTIDGKPAANVQVSFMPTDRSRPVASGNCDATGRYELFSGAADRKGAVAGSYKVVLSQLDSADQAALDARYSGGSAGPPKAEKPAFPETYRDAATSPKQVDVTVGSNSIDIQIP